MTRERICVYLVVFLDTKWKKNVINQSFERHIFIIMTSVSVNSYYSISDPTTTIISIFALIL